MPLKKGLSVLSRNSQGLLLLASLALSGFCFAEPADKKNQTLAENEYRRAIEILENAKNKGIPLYQDSMAPEACRLLRSAAGKGHIPAVIHLGSKYLTGNGLEKSVRTAFQYYTKAVKLFFKNKLLVPVLILALILGAAFLVCKTTRFCSVLKTRFLLKAAESGNPEKQYQLALCYLHGNGIPKQMGEARRLLEKSAEKGCAPAQIQMGRFFNEGVLVQSNRVKAAEWFQKAAQQGDPEGLYLIGQCYEQGAGVPLYLPKALGFYLLASARGNREAKERLGVVQEKMTEPQRQAGKSFAMEYAEIDDLKMGY